jgi:putative AlgH/UPF0301 family transcriptional regulator
MGEGLKRKKRKVSHMTNLESEGSAKMTIEDAIEILRKMDMKSKKRFSNEQRQAIMALGMAGWSGELPTDDERLLVLPKIVRKLVQIMAKKRVIQ